MTKQEALEAMRNGAKVRHRFFDKNEWMTIECGWILLEDGVRCPIHEFFSFRTGAVWDEGYTLLNSDQEQERSVATDDDSSNQSG